MPTITSTPVIARRWLAAAGCALAALAASGPVLALDSNARTTDLSINAPTSWWF